MIIFKKYIKYIVALVAILGTLYGAYYIAQKNGEYKEQIQTLNNKKEQLENKVEQQRIEFSSNLEAMNQSMLFYQERIEESEKKADRLESTFNNVRSQPLQECFNTVVPDDIINELNSRGAR